MVNSAVGAHQTGIPKPSNCKANEAQQLVTFDFEYKGRRWTGQISFATVDRLYGALAVRIDNPAALSRARAERICQSSEVGRKCVELIRRGTKPDDVLDVDPIVNEQDRDRLGRVLAEAGRLIHQHAPDEDEVLDALAEAQRLVTISEGQPPMHVKAAIVGAHAVLVHVPDSEDIRASLQSVEREFFGTTL